MSDTIPSADVLAARDELRKRLDTSRAERQWLHDHNHQVEAMVKIEIMNQIERAMWLLEALLDKAGVAYTYESE